MVPHGSIMDILAALQAEAFHLTCHSRTNTGAADTIRPIMALFDSGVPNEPLLTVSYCFCSMANQTFWLFIANMGQLNERILK